MTDDWTTEWLMTDVNFRHSSQYGNVSKKLCTKKEQGKNEINEEEHEEKGRKGQRSTS